MIVQACYCIYNEAEHIEKSLNSIVDFVDKVVVVDGPFLGYPSVSLQSDDGTLDILKQYKKVQVIHVPRRMRQPEKRSLYFTEDVDWYFIIDGDEIAVGDVAAGFEYVKSLEDKGALVEVKLRTVPTLYMRFVKYQPGLHYHGVHHYIYNHRGFRVTCRARVTQFKLVNMQRKNFQRARNMDLYRAFRTKHNRSDLVWESA